MPKFLPGAIVVVKFNVNLNVSYRIVKLPFLLAKFCPPGPAKDDFCLFRGNFVLF